jgi:hypothetical protein
LREELVGSLEDALARIRLQGGCHPPSIEPLTDRSVF